MSKTPDTLPAKLPPGYRWIKVPVTDAEAEQLAKRGSRLPSGRAWEALRRMAYPAIPQYPRGLKDAVAAMDPADTTPDDENPENETP